jgi:hypothetical protein
MARSRGTVAGPLLILLGAWGALVPFFGHSFSYGYTPSDTWHWTAARAWLEVLPGGVAFLGGVLLTFAGNRIAAMTGGWLASLAGAWFIIGMVILPWWSPGNIGTPIGSTDRIVWEQLGMFYGLGALILFLGAVGLGRASVIGVRDVAAAEARREVIDLTGTTSTTGEPVPTAGRTTT